MQKISYYVIAIVVAGVAVTSFWVYDRYLKTADEAFLYFQVDRGDIQEAIKVRSEVVAQKEFELEFPAAGTIEAVYVRDGDAVVGGQRLMKLETKDLDIQASQLAAVVAERRADLAKLLAGATAEDIKVSELKLAAAQVGLSEAKTNLVDKIRDAYAKSDDAVRTKTDRLFDNPRSGDPKLNITAGESIRSDLNFQRQGLEVTLDSWNASLALMTSTSDVTGFVQTAEQNTALILIFLNTLSPVVSNLTANSNLSQTTIDSYKTDLSAARANLSTAIANLTAAKEKYNLAAVNVSLYEREFALKRAPPRKEDVDIARARVQEAEGQLGAVQEKIRKSTLSAPSAGKVSKVNYEVGEVFRPGQPALLMVTNGYKLQSDVSELDIAKIRETDGNIVRIVLDAFPGKQFEGRVASVEAKEVVKTEDKYYRVNIVFDAAGANIRPGMSADATILSAAKQGVLRVPELAVYRDGATKYVKALSYGLSSAESQSSLERVEIQTGSTDGDFVEVVSGIEEGRTVVVTAE
jgi:RND family efflux transporter MFP subunit